MRIVRGRTKTVKPINSPELKFWLKDFHLEFNSVFLNVHETDFHSRKCTTFYYYYGISHVGGRVISLQTYSERTDVYSA